MRDATREGRRPSPRLLFLAYAFPPSTAVGALRSWYLAKHLARRGWKVTVATPDPMMFTRSTGGTAASEACRTEGIDRVLTSHDLRGLTNGWLEPRWWERNIIVRLLLRVLLWTRLVDYFTGWRRPLRQALTDLRQGGADLVLVSGPPHGLFVDAIKLSKRIGARCVVDYRDLWTSNPHDGRGRSKQALLQETEVLRTVDGVIVASPSMLECLAPRLDKQARPLVLYNGFDPEDLESIPAGNLSECSVVYAGSFYPPKNVIDPVLEAVVLANRTAPRGSARYCLHYYGGDGEVVRRAAAKRRALDQVEIHGTVSRAEVIGALKACTVAAVITTIQDEQSLAERTIVTSKVFEAMGAGARVLLVAPKGSDARGLVEAARAGRAFRASEVKEIAAWLTEVRETGGPVSGAAVAPYSWPELAAEADAYLRSLVHSADGGVS